MANTTFQGADIVSPRETLFEQVRFAGYPRGPTSAADLRLSANLRPCSHRETSFSRSRGACSTLRPLFAQGDLGNHANPVHVEPSTPVRTGRPQYHSSFLPFFFFDPCSHRETEVSALMMAASALRPLFAQGDPCRYRFPATYISSTPVRTGRPAARSRSPRRWPFDPCSHRETAPEATYKPPAILRPLLAQGDRQAWSAGMSFFTSTPVRTGRPAASRTSTARCAFDPCSHRETQILTLSTTGQALRPLFAQGDRCPSGLPLVRHPSTPVRTGRPGEVRSRRVQDPFDPCSHREARGTRPGPSDDSPSTPVRTGRPACRLLTNPHHAFDPCSHRETSFSRSRGACSTLRPLFAQGDPRTSASGVTRPSSTPVRTGRPLAGLRT